MKRFSKGDIVIYNDSQKIGYLILLYVNKDLGDPAQFEGTIISREDYGIEEGYKGHWNYNEYSLLISKSEEELDNLIERLTILEQLWKNSK